MSPEQGLEPEARSPLARLAGEIRGEQRTSAQVVAFALARIRELEPRVRAFVWLDEAAALRRAAESDRDPHAGGLLRGVPLGIKDIIDTAGIPTECGSHVLAGRTPECSAAVVKTLEAAGALVLGKTVSAELAFAAPGPTRNPWNPARTPGGSSMGSAAAVGAGMLPGAIGTQTNSSLIMPAALCGAVGFKPSGGTLPTEGVMPFSPTLDQLGCFARSVDDAVLLAQAMGLALAPRPLAAAPVLAVARTSDWADAAEPVRAEFARNLERLEAAGASLVEEPLPPGLDEARIVHRTIMAYEAVRALAPLVGDRRDELSVVLQRFLAEGAAVSEADYAAARTERERLIEAFAAWAAAFDAVVTPAAPFEAPSRQGTGDPRFCTRWTLVDAPALVIPVALGPERLPIGLQFVGAPGRDERVAYAAGFAERLFLWPGLPHGA